MNGWFCGTLPNTNSSPLKSDRNPKGKDCLPTIIFQGRAVKLQGCSDHHQALMSPYQTNGEVPKAIYIYMYIYIYTVLYMYFSILHVCSVNKTKSTYSNSDFFQPQISWDHTRRKLMEIVVQQRIYFIGAVVSTLNYINAIWQVYLAQDFCTGNSYPNSQASFQNNRSCRFPLQVSKGKKMQFLS